MAILGLYMYCRIALLGVMRTVQGSPWAIYPCSCLRSIAVARWIVWSNYQDGPIVGTGHVLLSISVFLFWLSVWSAFELFVSYPSVTFIVSLFFFFYRPWRVRQPVCLVYGSKKGRYRCASRLVQSFHACSEICLNWVYRSSSSFGVVYCATPDVLVDKDFCSISDPGFSRAPLARHRSGIIGEACLCWCVPLTLRVVQRAWRSLMSVHNPNDIFGSGTWMPMAMMTSGLQFPWLPSNVGSGADCTDQPYCFVSLFSVKPRVLLIRSHCFPQAFRLPMRIAFGPLIFIIGLIHVRKSVILAAG